MKMMSFRNRNKNMINTNKYKNTQLSLEEGINNISESISKYEFRENSILYKQLLKTMEEREKSLDRLSRKSAITEGNNKQSFLKLKSPKSNLNIINTKKQSITTTNARTRHKRCSNWLGDSDKDSLRFIQNISNENDIMTDKRIVFPTNKNNYNNKLNNKEIDRTFLYEKNYILSEPSIIAYNGYNRKSNYNNYNNGYKTNKHIQNYFYINNELYKTNYCNKSFDNYLSGENINKKYYNNKYNNKNKTIDNIQQSRTPDRYFIRKKNNKNSNKKSYAMAFILCVEKIIRLYLLKSMYKFFFYIKNLPKRKNKNINFDSKSNISKESDLNNSIYSLKGVKYNKRQSLLMNKIKDKLISISPNSNKKSELYRNYQELNKSNEKIKRRKNIQNQKNTSLKKIKFNNYINWAKKKQFDSNNYNHIYNMKKNSVKENKIVLSNQILETNGKLNICMRFMSHNKQNSKAKKNKVYKKLEICKESFFSIQRKIKKAILVKTITETTNNRNRNIKLDSIKEEEEIN